MASNRLLAVLLAGFALTASAGLDKYGNPCTTKPPAPPTTEAPCTPVKPLSDAQIAGIAVGSAAGAAALIGGAIAATKPKEEATEAPVTEAPLPETTIKKRIEETTTTVAVEEGASSSSELPIWAWITIGVVACLCLSGLVFMLTQKKTTRKKKKSKAKPAAAAPAVAVAEEVAPLIEVPPLMPTGTALLQPSYQVMAAPATTAYQYASVAQPVTTAYETVAAAAPVVYEQVAAAPVVYEQAVAAPVAYAQPMIGTAMAYAAPTAGFVVQ